MRRPSRERWRAARGKLHGPTETSDVHDSEDPNSVRESAPDEAAERLVLRFLAEAPRLPGAGDLGAVSSAVGPWPHQLRVVRRAVESYPQSFLFADEVGLGKTLEAGLALRQLWISGRVRRALILVPRAVLRQWQEELREKLALDVPRLEGRQVLDVFDRDVAPDPEADPEAGDEASVWDRYPLLLASSQTARSKRRRDELLAAKAWDLVIVDEAHHARRRQARLDAFRPNRLLELLAGPAVRDGERIRRRGLVDRCRSLYLLTATPMQVHPVEVWDLLRLLGLGGRWGARPDTFVAFFEELRKPSAARDWRFLLTLLADAVESHATWGGELHVPDDLRPIVELAVDGDLDAAAERARACGAGSSERLDDLLRSANPVRALVFRHTRDQLRRYRQAGHLAIDVPDREPENVWVELSPEERALYRRVESYLSRFYQRYEAKRTGLGFVMTVYRRRLTSSFDAVRRSLERRREWLLGRGDEALLGADDRLDDDPGDQADLFAEIDDEAVGELPSTPISRDEIEHLDAFLDALASLDGDSKLDRLIADLDDLLTQRDRVLVFTQYTDTMDHLRDRLRGAVEAAAGGEAIACYSGRGGERWHGEAWAAWDKESLKSAFGAGRIRVLLCTEAASEGLNLQTCGVLINYDMPWNPMRVEQRIGRIDRIGQTHATVWIRNYFYADTVEATIYRRLTDRIDWFRAVVGELQPILHRVGEALELLALVPEDRRAKPLEETLADLRRSLDDAPADPMADDRGSAGAAAVDTASIDGSLAAVPAQPREVEAAVVGSTLLGDRFTTTDTDGVYRLDDGESRPVTFRPACFAERPYTTDLLTWGTRRFERLLAEVEPPPTSDDPAGIGLYQSSNPAPVSLFMAPTAGGVEALTDLAALRRCLAVPAPAWQPATERDASATFSKRRTRALRETTRIETGRRRAERRALVTEAADVVRTAAVIELVRAESPGLFDLPLDFGWGHEAIEAQRRHGPPFDRLLDLLADPVQSARPTVAHDDPIAVSWRGRSHADLDRGFATAATWGADVVERWSTLDEAEAAERRASREPSAGGLLDRTYFLVNADEAGPERLDPAEVEPFVDGLPWFAELAPALQALADSRQEGRDLLAGAARRPEELEWVTLGLAGRATPDRFAAPAPSGEPGIFRLAAVAPRDAALVAVVRSSGVTFGRWFVEPLWDDGVVEGSRVRLDTEDGPIAIDDPEDIRLIAEWLGPL